MNALKPCPFCGEMPEVEPNGDCYCDNYICPMAPDSYMPGDWNTRPIEDDLRKRIAELEDGIEIMKLEVSKSHSCIAELEAESERFTAHSDIERQDDKSPNDTQTQTIVYGYEFTVRDGHAIITVKECEG